MSIGIGTIFTNGYIVVSLPNCPVNEWFIVDSALRNDIFRFYNFGKF